MPERRLCIAQNLLNGVHWPPAAASLPSTQYGCEPVAARRGQALLNWRAFPWSALAAPPGGRNRCPRCRRLARDCADVSASVDRIRKHQGNHCRAYEWKRKPLMQDGRETGAADHADLGAGELHGRHHGKRDQRRRAIGLTRPLPPPAAAHRSRCRTTGREQPARSGIVRDWTPRRGYRLFWPGEGRHAGGRLGKERGAQRGSDWRWGAASLLARISAV
jgi:hypothetical protein